MWVGAAIAAGVRWGWPAVFATFKPSVAIFGAIGIQTRAWWIAAGALAIVSLPFIALWVDYPRVLVNSSAEIGYSIGDLPYLGLPIVAWLVSSRRGTTSPLDWTAALLARGSGRLLSR
jgi:hypothetical protein